MIHPRRHNVIPLVTGAEQSADGQIQCVGGVERKHHMIRVFAVDQRVDSLAALIHQPPSFARLGIRPTTGAGAQLGGITHHRLMHRPGLGETRGRIVHIDARPTGLIANRAHDAMIVGKPHLLRPTTSPNGIADRSVSRFHWSKDRRRTVGGKSLDHLYPNGYSTAVIEVRKTDTFTAWLDDLRDSHTRARVLARIERLVNGNPGDVKPVGKGVSELRIDYGAGYRVYYTTRDKELIILRAGGDKRTQARDIKTALRLARDL